MDIDIEPLEALALSEDRAVALAGLLPGTSLDDYFRGVHLQHEGRLDEVDAILTSWQSRHRDEGELHRRLARRQLLLRAGQDLAAHADTIRFQAGLSLDDQAEAAVAAQRFPTRLDPALVDEAALVKEALGRASDLSYVTTWALPSLLARMGELDATRRRDLLSRLSRANAPGVVDLIAAELEDHASRGFGALPIQHLLTLAQLVELGERLPTLREDGAWVSAVLARMRPRDGVDWETDNAARRAYLDALSRFVDTLAPSFSSLRALVLYHQLDLDRRLGAYDRGRFLRYLELAQNVSHAAPSGQRRSSPDRAVRPGVDPAKATGLSPVDDDEPLIRELLEHFLALEEVDAFAGALRRDWLLTVLATARLLAGDPDTRRFTAMLPKRELAALEDRAELSFSPRNPARFAEGAPVVLDVLVKNVKELVVKVFRIDVLAYFIARGAEVDTSLDLDGMVAGDERTLRLAAPPIQRTRQRIELSSCARPGTYIVELIGNGKSSRALIRKGALRHAVRVGVAGPTVRVFDEEGRLLRDARVWMGGREYAPREDGEISIPFSTQPGSAPMLLIHGDLAQVETLYHPSETYDLVAGIHLERESLVPGKTARVLFRPMLLVSGAAAPIVLLEEPRVEITVTDLAGIPSTKIEPVVLDDGRETVVSLRVPEDAVKIAVSLRGRVRVSSTQKTVDLSDGYDAEHNLVHQGEHTEVLHLATTAGGHVLHLLGKTGEARPGRSIALSIKHVAVTFPVAVTLSTDERGRVELGHLPGVESLSATLPSGVERSWWLFPDVAAPEVVHAEVGTEITLPAPPLLAADELRLALSLCEVRAGSIVRDVTDRVRLSDRALLIAGLELGRYELSCRGLSAGVSIKVVPAAQAEGFSTSGSMTVELSPPTPLVRGMSADGAELVVELSGAGPNTRVHLIATLFRPDRALPSDLRRAPEAKLAVDSPPVRSHYVSGRDIGDEHRYVLERRSAARRPGVLLDKPSLLLDPWALRATSTALQAAAAGGAYSASPARDGGAPAAYPLGSMTEERRMNGDEAASTTVDFLAAPAVVLDNLRPDADGRVRVPRESLGAAQFARATLVDPALTSTADLALAEIAPAHRDRRLRVALDPARHFAEERRVDVVRAGATIVVEDVRTGKLELVDTLPRAYEVLLTLRGDDTLREFAFVAAWHTLDASAKRRKYSQYACHELNLFLSRKDPEFFAAVVRVHLVHKRHKTFIDRYLLGEDLSRYLEPWAFGRLNTLERVLFARRVPALRDAVARLVGDAVDLTPPDPERDARLVDTLLGAAALAEAGGGVFGVVAGTALEEIFAHEGEARSSPTDRMEELLSKDMEERSRGGPVPRASRSEPPAAAAMPKPTERAKNLVSHASFGGGGRAARDAADLRERARGEALYRGADKTQEWAESSYWHRRIEEITPELIAPNRFFRDLAAHREGPFLSPHLGECTTSFTEALSCLALLDLPFIAAPHDVTVDDARFTLTARSDALAARARIIEVSEPRAAGAILIGQSYLRADDRFAWDGAERRDKYVTGELLTGVVYQCRVVVTNTSSSQHRLDVLLQIPRGAVPVSSGFLTRTVHLDLGPYSTQAVEYAFYFPALGEWSHFPAHVIRAGELCTFAAPVTLHVVREPTTVDAGSWAHVSQHGSTDEVVAFLGRENLGRVDLDRIAFRMRDRDAFVRVTALLAARFVYHDRLWAYGLFHADRARVAEWLRHNDAFVRLGGPVLEGAIAELDPVERGWYQHLEYAPLINARAYQLGERRRILNDALSAQYRAFLEVVAHRARVEDDDWLAAAHYLFCLDRIDDALRAFDRVHPERVTARVQYDYLAAYAACCRGDLAKARALAAPWLEHPVDRVRHRFAALVAMVDEAEGVASEEGFSAAALGGLAPDHRGTKMADLAARQPALNLVLDRGEVVLEHHNLAACQVCFHRMDLELVFSRQPFLQGDVERFSWIEPNHVDSLTLGSDGRTVVPIPEAMRRADLVVEAVAPGLRAAVTRYAHDLVPQLAHRYGQIRLLRASTEAPLPAAYVKVYARQRGGAVAFYKDGYTDLRGRFDYVTLSTDDLDRVERFAILVVSDDAGATVLEAPPPQR